MTKKKRRSKKFPSSLAKGGRRQDRKKKNAESLSFAADTGGRGATTTTTRAQQDRGDQVPAEEAGENGDPRAGVRDPRDAESRSEVPDPRAGDSEAQAGRYVESPQPNLFEAGFGHNVLPAVRRAPSVAQLSGQLRATTTTSTGPESAAELRDRVSGEGRGIRDRFLPAESFRADDVGRWLYGLAKWRISFFFAVSFLRRENR